MENTDRKIIVKDEKGKEHEGEIIFTFEANGDNFVLYELEDDAFAMKVKEDGSMIPVEDDEWKLIEKIYSEYIEEMNFDSE